MTASVQITLIICIALVAMVWITNRKGGGKQ
jgi:preprotein translocase subunit SecG